ncbi:MAG: CDP-alcohol phosphatidyltransferase family protein [Candidatus Pacebacteria bacterium]|jgi:phosphatidylglycerophosphate synthase|nr:hypothetical protein [bacterium]MDP6527884.1 CDP-alcohol phosphatidyltransferase family protein [Candidatus Paceibacterota bacterium]MDP6659694.1 CDP-alcohol phosphatidyltransferase family protein [Candidatus Paceibacterota bacterium]|tara:strand:- start:34459 stop:35220 length:762 start_codon:yes stop_codon:yes gene_type:complete
MKLKTARGYSIKKLRKICQSTAPNPARESKVGLFTRIFSIYFTKLFLYTPLTPNQITVIGMSTYFVGIGFLFFNEPIYNAIAVFLVFMSIVFDGCDGEVARFRESSSAVGNLYAEPVSHDIQYGVSFFLVGIAVYLGSGDVVHIILGAVAGISKLLFRLLEIRTWYLTQSVKIKEEEIEKLKQEYEDLPAYKRLVYWTKQNLFTQNGILLVLFLVTIVNRVDLLLWFFGVGNLIFWILLFGKKTYELSKNPPG